MSAFFVAIAVAVIFILPLWTFFVFIEVFIILGLNEFLTIAEKKGVQTHRPLGVFLGALVPFAVFFQSESLILMLVVLAVFLFHFQPQLRNETLLSSAVMIFGIVYLPWFCSYFFKIRQLEQGGWWVFYVLLLVKGGDAGAYFVGKKWGRRKLIEHISPNKSVEGAVGGLATTIVLSLLSLTYLHGVDIFDMILLGLLISILSQLGDLVESLIKRDAGVKDSGQVPGLGGILDMMDSLILTIPFVYFYLTRVLNLS